MDDADPMGRGQRVAHLLADGDDLVERKRTLGIEAVAQAASFEQLHH